MLVVDIAGSSHFPYCHTIAGRMIAVRLCSFLRFGIEILD